MGSYVTLLRLNPNYRNLWLGQLISFLGDWFNLLAGAALIASLSGAGTAISYLFLARFLPLFFASPFAGVIADRYDRRQIMIASDILRALTVLGFLLVRSSDQIWLFYLLTILQFVMSAFYIPAHRALLPMVVEEKDLVTANALDGFTWSSMLAIGALLGGLATAYFGITAAFIIDAATFLISAWFIGRVIVAKRESPVGEGALVSGQSGGFFEFLDGLRYLRGRHFILGLSLVKAGGSLIWGGINVLEIALAEERFPINGSLTLGLLYTITGIGTGVGPLLLRRWLGDSRAGLMRAISASFVLLTAGVFMLGSAPTLAWVAIGTLTRSFGSGSLWVFSSAILQTTVEDRFRGRIFAFEFATLTLTQSIGVLCAGMAQDNLGMDVQQVFLLTGVVSVGVSVCWALFRSRTNMHPAAVT
jgi:MFS family permease